MQYGTIVQSIKKSYERSYKRKMTSAGTSSVLRNNVRLGVGVVTVGSVISGVYYTWCVEERKRIRAEVNHAARKPVVGSVDDVTTDRLKPGDVIIFERDCSALHLPLAAHCYMTKKLLQSSIDHVGVVFNDSKTRLPAVLEAVPWVGVRATPFTERVAEETDFRITVITDEQLSLVSSLTLIECF